MALIISDFWADLSRLGKWGVGSGKWGVGSEWNFSFLTSLSSLLTSSSVAIAGVAPHPQTSAKS